MAWLEARAVSTESPPAAPPATARSSPLALPSPSEVNRAAAQIEGEVGRHGFAGAGVLALAMGAGFLLSLPYPGAAAYVPSLAGAALALGLFVLAETAHRTLGFVTGPVRGAAMALLYISALRLSWFSPRPALPPGSVLAGAVLAFVAATNVAYAFQRRAPWLFGVALLLAAANALIVGGAGYVLLSLVALAGAAVVAARLAGWTWTLPLGIVAGNFTYVLWAVGNPVRGGAYRFVHDPASAPAAALAMLAAFALGGLFRRDRAREDGMIHAATALNCALGYAGFLLHTAAAFPRTFADWHAAAALMLLGLAIAFWRREQSRVATFFYAMTGYAAMTMAIVKLAPAPAVFVWLSLQSVVVVATAIWFRSRFIVVGNFLVYALIVLTYAVLTERETGISLGFGLVALVSARILHWQQRRLDLRTELMRNAYLVSAFIVFPYALYHLVPPSYVGLAWVGLASGYYGLSLVIRNQKYRWMGHATLLLSLVYVVVVGTRQFEPIYRVLSFLALGAVLLLVSRTFTRRRETRPGSDPRDSHPLHSG